jgi:neutral ceramidase
VSSVTPRYNMKIVVTLIVLASACFPSGTRAQTGSVTAPFSKVQAGFAERDITPGIGMEQPGGYGKSFHKSFHDSCKVRASVFDDGKKRVAIVGLDALVVPRSVVVEARLLIQKACGISGDAVLVCASHSHSSGPVGMVLPGEFDTAPDLVKKLAYEESSCADAGYLQRLTHEIVAGVVAADRAKVPVLGTRTRWLIIGV